MILGMTKEDAGEIRVLDNQSPYKNTKIREEIGAVMDEVDLPYSMKTAEIGKMMSLIYKNWDEAVFTAFVSRLKIPVDKKFNDFSRGNKMKLGIACALSHQPKLLVLDEATSGLDPVIRDELLDILMDFTRDETHGIIMSSHIVSDLEKACDYIAFIHEGELLLMEEKDRLTQEYGKVSCSAEAFAQINPAMVVGKRETAYGVEVIALKSGLPAGMNIQPVDIEELFVMMVKGERG